MQPHSPECGTSASDPHSGECGYERIRPSTCEENDWYAGLTFRRRKKGPGWAMADELAGVIEGCRTGSQFAQRQLYERYHRTVYRLVVRLVGKPDAADVTQEIFVRVLARIGSFRGTAAFSTWLYRVATNECLRHLGRR